MIELLERRICLSVTYLYGDANLDGHVDGTDYSLIDNGFNMGLHGWINGDFNGDGKVDGADYSLIDNSFHDGAQPGTIYRIGPSETLKTISAAAALAQPGDTVLIDPGTYHEQVNLPRSGLPGKPITFQAVTPGTVTVDGTGYSYIWNGGGGYGNQSYIDTDGLIFSHCANPYQSGAVFVGSNSSMANCTIQYTDSAGLMLQGSNITLNNDISQYNGEEGIVGDACSNVVATDCITRYNNNGMTAPSWAGSSNAKEVNGLWYAMVEPGGGKWHDTTNVVIDGWQMYGNIGGGISFDIDNRNTTVENCDIHDQSLFTGESPYDSPGISYEISFGPCVISNCTITNNPGGGLNVMSSTNVQVLNNTLTNNYLDLTNWNRGAGYSLNNVTVEHNVFNEAPIYGSGDLVPWNASSASVEKLTVDYDTFINVEKTPGQFLVEWGGVELKSLAAVQAMNLEAHGTFVS